MLTGTVALSLPLALFFCATKPTAGNALRVDGYEVKFALDPEASLVQGGPASEPVLSERVASALSVKKAKRMEVNFLDDCTQRLLAHGWSVRLRQKDQEWELTYKRRYVVEGTIADALRAAERDGFRAGQATQIEIDLSGDRRVLSLSFERALSSAPVPGQFRALALSEPPPPLAGDTLAALEAARVYGPIPAVRWKGRLGDAEVDVETWLMAGRPIVELSAKAVDLGRAEELRRRLRQFVTEERLAAPGDTLKTQAVLAAFRPVDCR